MIRFIDLGTQVTCDKEDLPLFAWYNTIVDKFEEHSGTVVWESWEDFVQDYEGSEIERYKSLFRGKK